MNQVVAAPGPVEADAGIADMVGHLRGSRRENGHVGASLSLQLQLGLFQTVANLIVGDADVAGNRRAGRIIQACELRVPKRLESLGGRRVMTVTVNDHGAQAYCFIALSILSRSAIVGTQLAALD